MSTAAHVVFWIVLVSLYFLPTIIAAGRRHHNRTAIAVLNLFLGWTVLGWLAALVWAFATPPPR